VDLEVAAVAGRDSGDHVRDERSREPVEGARRLLVVLAGDQDRAVLALERDVVVERAGELALRALHLERVALERDVHALRDLHRLPSYAAHQIKSRTSPPNPFLSASRPVMTPDDVETIAMPRPPSTRGISVLRAYTRRPGLLMRRMPETAEILPPTYFIFTTRDRKSVVE